MRGLYKSSLQISALYCYKNLKISKQLPNAMELIICNLLATPASNYTQTQMTV